jgi:hypothetical protein
VSLGKSAKGHEIAKTARSISMVNLSQLKKSRQHFGIMALVLEASLRITVPVSTFGKDLKIP